MSSKTYQCYTHNGLTAERYTSIENTHQAIDSFVDELRKELKNDNTLTGMVAVTLARNDGLENSENVLVDHRTLEFTTNAKDPDSDGRAVEIHTVSAYLPSSIGASLYSRLAEHSGLWTQGGPTDTQEELTFGLGDINNEISIDPSLDK